MSIAAFAITHPIPPLNKAPASINDLAWQGQTKATHFSDVVVGRGGGTDVPGAALAAASWQVDYSMGNFQLPFTLPKGAALFAKYAVLIEAFTTDGTTAGTAPTINLGLTAAGSEIGTVTVPATANAIASALLATVNPATGATLYLSAASNTGNVTGIVLVSLIYFVPPAKWS
jgi:hypothetical protein